MNKLKALSLLAASYIVAAYTIASPNAVFRKASRRELIDKAELDIKNRKIDPLHDRPA